MACMVFHAAEARIVDGKPQWTKTPAEIHIAKELIVSIDEAGLDFIKERYTMGSDCPDDPSVIHSYRKDDI